MGHVKRKNRPDTVKCPFCKVGDAVLKTTVHPVVDKEIPNVFYYRMCKSCDMAFEYKPKENTE